MESSIKMIYWLFIILFIWNINLTIATIVVCKEFFKFKREEYCRQGKARATLDKLKESMENDIR